MGGQATHVGSKKRLMRHRESCRGGRLVHACGIMPRVLESCRAGSPVRSRGACLRCWRSCLGGQLMQTRGACLRCWRSCLDARLVHACRIMPGVLAHLPGVLGIMFRRSADSRTRDYACGARIMPGVLAIMPRRVADSDAGFVPGVLAHMPRRSVWGPLVATCPAQPGIPAERLDRGVFDIQTQKKALPI